MPHFTTLSKTVFRTSLPRGEAQVTLHRVSRNVQGWAMPQTQIEVESRGASWADVEALKERVAPHLQAGGWQQGPGFSWIGVVYGERESAQGAIDALGDLKLDEAWMLQARREEKVREVHEAMWRRSLGLTQTPRGAWWLANPQHV